MNFYDVYITLSHNPEAERAINSICSYCGCSNSLENLREALWKKPSRAQHMGAFPFDEETGKIYDVLWKAAAAENYSTAERIGRWIMKTLVPPADDEGMGTYGTAGNRKRTQAAPAPRYEPEPPRPRNHQEEPQHHQPPQDEEPKVEDEATREYEDENGTLIVIEEQPHREEGVTRRTNKKND